MTARRRFEELFMDVYNAIMSDGIKVDTDMSGANLTIDDVQFILKDADTEDTLVVNDDGSINAVMAQLGEVQATPTANTVLARLKALETKLDGIINGTSPAVAALSGSNLQEQKTQADAAAGVLTFDDVIKEIEIYNRGATDGTFTINGINIIVPAGEVFQAKMGGTPSSVVAIAGSTSYVIGRYV